MPSVDFLLHLSTIWIFILLGHVQGDANALLLKISSTTCDTISVTWDASSTLPGATTVTLSYSVSTPSKSDDWQDSRPRSVTRGHETITDLMADTNYAIKASYDITNATRIVYAATLKGPPNAPSLEMNNMYITVTKDEGNQQLTDYEYILQWRPMSGPDDAHKFFGAWETVASKRNIEETPSWPITQDTVSNLSDNKWYQFRVYLSPKNESSENDRFCKRSDTSRYINHHHETTDKVQNDLQIYLPLAIGILLIFLTALGCWRRKVHLERKFMKSLLPSGATTIYLPGTGDDKELMNIRNLTTLAIAAARHEGVRDIPADFKKNLTFIGREQITINERLGSGAFGEVYKGEAVGIGTVAIKTLKDGATESERLEFVMEAYFTSLVRHQNVISFHGVCLDNDPHLIVLELMEGGDLLKYLRNARNPGADAIRESKLSLTDMLEIALDVARAFEYFEKKKFIHRDLAARNCLVSTKEYSSAGRCVKVGDFGLAKDLIDSDYYHKKGDGMLPIRWMAPESIFQQLYTSKSDVWSYGILLWEVMTLGKQPYAEFSNEQVIQRLKQNSRLEKPKHCAKPIYDLMKQCWEEQPSKRPSFETIVAKLTGFLNNENVRVALTDFGVNGFINKGFADDDGEFPRLRTTANADPVQYTKVQ